MNTIPTTIHIRTIDGTQHLFRWSVQSGVGADYTIAGRIEKFLNQQSIAVTFDDRLLVIPMHQIKSIEVSPLHHKIPDAVVPNVTRCSRTKRESMRGVDRTSRARPLVTVES